MSVGSTVEIDGLTGLPIGQVVDPTSAAWPNAKILTGRTVQLEALNPAAHSDDLWNAVGGEHNAALWLYMSEGPFSARLDFDAAVQNAVQHDDPVFFAIIDRQTGKSTGWCSLLNIRPRHRSVEVGYLLFSSHLQRTIGATETLYLLTKYAFDELGYLRYEWKCNALNAKSRAAAGRFGFVFEGVFRRHMIIKGRNRDSAWFSITAEEWPAIRRGLESWLDPANFDEDGKQRRKLSDLIHKEQA